MKLFKSIEVNEGDLCERESAWINRITVTYCRYPVEKAEIWIVWLPSYGMECAIFTDKFVWSQRGFHWNLHTGEFYKITRPVTD